MTKIQGSDYRGVMDEGTLAWLESNETGRSAAGGGVFKGRAGDCSLHLAQLPLKDTSCCEMVTPSGMCQIWSGGTGVWTGRSVTDPQWEQNRWACSLRFAQ